MFSDHSCSYRGYEITTRCRHGDPPYGNSCKQFESSFSIVPHAATHREAWQEFPRSLFISCAEARANALSAGKRSVDEDILSA